VKEQSSAYLGKARELLVQAAAILRMGLNEPAGRTAYLAGFHAAQALIFETSGRIYKSHSGVHGEFARLVKDDPRVDDQLRAFLGRAHGLRAIADYETGPAPTSRSSAPAKPSKPPGGLTTASPVLRHANRPRDGSSTHHGPASEIRHQS
jgi:uncharacterized protein (UPF0332 family)